METVINLKIRDEYSKPQIGITGPNTSISFMISISLVTSVNTAGS